MAETFTIFESKKAELPLTVEQAEVLRALGRELRGKAEYHANNSEADDSEDEEVKELQRSVIRCESLGDGVYRVRVANAIGSIALPGATLHVHPKIPLNHFAHLARHAVASPRLSSERVSIGTLDVFWELVARWTVTEIEHLLRIGLLVDYKEFTDDLNAVRGRVNVRATTRNFLNGRLEANCTFDELDLDHPLNRVLRAAARLIAGSPIVGDQELKKRASYIDRAMDGVGQLQSGDLRASIDRRTQRYAIPFDLSQRILGLAGANVEKGERAGRTFLIPTPGLIEEAVRNLLRRALHPISVTNKGRTTSGDVHFSLNPDLVIGEGVITGDVKYKIASETWNRSDVQQAAMFATGFHAQAAFIATFNRGSEAGDLNMQLGALPMARITWNASDHSDPEQAEFDFLNRVRSFVTGKMTFAVVA